MKSITMVTVTPRAVAWSRIVSICWGLPSASATQVRSWVGSRRLVSSNMAAMTAGRSSVRLAASHVPVTTGPGRRAGLSRCELRRVGMMPAAVRGAGSRSYTATIPAIRLRPCFSPGGEPGGQLRRCPGGPRGRAGAQAARAHHDALAVGLQAQDPAWVWQGAAGGVERLGVHRGRAGQILHLPLAQAHPGCPLDRLPGIGERPARRLHRRPPPQSCRVPAHRQVQHRIAWIQVPRRHYRLRWLRRRFWRRARRRARCRAGALRHHLRRRPGRCARGARTASAALSSSARNGPDRPCGSP